MYQYDTFDHAFVQERVAEFSQQVQRRLNNELTEDEFKPLRLQNGVYLQLHAYMLRIAIPYGALHSKQMRMLSFLAQNFDKGYGHFTTRQNIQFNWPKLKDIPKMLEHLASVEMHAIQTSGNCIRNVTSDPFAGATADEFCDPRPYAEFLRQWSSLHPEFLYLPRKFKIAINGAQIDRTALKLHDVGLKITIKNQKPSIAIYVGGGQGRTPVVAKSLLSDVQEQDLLPYLEAIMRVYNAYGRRDNKYKARIKILVDELGIASFKKQVEEEFSVMNKEPFAMALQELERIKTFFTRADLPKANENLSVFHNEYQHNAQFKAWVDHNVFTHYHHDYGVVSVSLKTKGAIPGDATYQQNEWAG